MQRLLRGLGSIVAVALCGFLAISPAVAVDTGSPAWSVGSSTVYEGPGDGYKVKGDLEAAVRLRVDRCHILWCEVHTSTVHGWVPAVKVTFGQTALPPFHGPRLNYPSGGPGQVCLYEGSNYTGDYVCAGSGTAARDLLLWGKDNRYSSIRIEGNVSAIICSDRNFFSACERVIASQPRLHRFLDNAVSSYAVY